MILQKFMCPTFTNLDMMTSLKTRHSRTCFCMDHILIKDKAIRYGQLNAKRKQVTEMCHVIHLYWIQINNYFTDILEDLNMVQQSGVAQIYCEMIHKLGNHSICLMSSILYFSDAFLSLDDHYVKRTLNLVQFFIVYIF